MEIIIKKKPKLAFLYDKSIEITFNVEKCDVEQIQALEINDKQLYKLELKKYHQKRSITQNSYMWALINTLADKLGLGRTELYKKFVKEYGKVDYIAIKSGAVPIFTQSWEEKGLGFFVDDLGESKLDGFSKLAIYYGTHTYNTQEMTRIVEGVINECQEQGIATMTLRETLMLTNENDRSRH